MICVRPVRDGDGGALVSANSINIDGDLKGLEVQSTNANLQATGEIKRIRQRDKSESDQFTGQFTARRFGKVEAQGGDGPVRPDHDRHVRQSRS